MKLVCVLLVSLAVAASAAAGATKPSLTLASTAVGGTFAGSGCGLRPGRDVFVYLYRQGSTVELAGVATHDDTAGCFTFTTGYVFDSPGGYSAYVYTVKPELGPGAYNQNHPAIDLDFVVT